jgi:hypothetical protein
MIIRIILNLLLRAHQNATLIIAQGRSINLELNQSNLVENVLAARMVLVEYQLQIFDC